MTAHIVKTSLYILVYTVDFENWSCNLRESEMKCGSSKASLNN